ncbi:MAG TPA: hypothetical protein VML96_08895, partial [Egibacteraceae bacterium]|nr:hypothetical protein [Egibacteraceae bacterium]
ESERLATAWGGRAELVRSRGDSGGDEALDPEPDTEEAQTLSGEPIVRARASQAAASLHRAALDQPATQQAAEDAAPVDQPAAEEPAAEEPAAEEPAAEESGAEDSGVEESDVAESEAEEVPAEAELSALEHAAEAQAAADEPASDGSPAQGTAEQLVADADADAAEAPAAEAPAAGQPKVDGLAAAAESRPDAADGGDADVIPIKPPRGGMIIDGDNLAPQALRAAALSHLHPKLVRGIKRGMHDLHNVVLDRLRRAAGETDPGAFLPTDEELRTLAGLVDELLAQGYEAGGIAASRLVDRRLPRASSSRDLGDDFVDDASGRVLRSLMATLRMGLSSGEELDALTSRVRSTFGELKSATAEQLAATHLIHAYELGMLDSWAAGGITHRRWVLGKEPRCPEGRCRHNDQTGALALTEAFPSGHDAPPVHVGCTCTTVPISEPA